MKIRRLILENVRSIKKLDLDFTDPMTDEPLSMVVLAGANGSGKTTMLETIFELVSSLGPVANQGPLRSTASQNSKPAAQLVLGMLIDSSGLTETDRYDLELPAPTVLGRYEYTLGLAFGDVKEGDRVVQSTSLSETLNVPRQPKPISTNTHLLADYQRRIRAAVAGDEEPFDGMLFFPHDRRLSKVIPGSIQPPTEKHEWAFKYESFAEWNSSIEGYLVWLDYLDLQDFRSFRTPGDRFPKAVQIVNEILVDKVISRVKDGRVQVNTTDGVTHDLDLLSSGEKQLTLLLLEIARRMNPGRIVMIDEPEVSLHPTWQRALIYALRSLAQQYDGQVILATHSQEIVRHVFPEEVKWLSPLDVPLGPEILEGKVVS